MEISGTTALLHRHRSVAGPRNPSGEQLWFVLSYFCEKLDSFLMEKISQARVRNLIGGEFVESRSESSIDVINPVNFDLLSKSFFGYGQFFIS